MSERYRPYGHGENTAAFRVTPTAMLYSGLRGSAKRVLEPRVVAYASEIVVPARLLAEGWVQLDGPPKVGERLVGAIGRERGEAGVVVMKARVVRHLGEAFTNRFERVGVALLPVGDHRLSMEPPS